MALPARLLYYCCGCPGAKRNKLVEGSILLTKQTLSLLKLLIARFPEFEYEALFTPSPHNELQILMAK